MDTYRYNRQELGFTVIIIHKQGNTKLTDHQKKGNLNITSTYYQLHYYESQRTVTSLFIES